jgi:glutamate-1-semialdehyde 2,1-aminomutase
MTSRLAPGGLASLYGLNPDMKSYGKWLGGGLAFGAFGGREDVMGVFDPRGENCLIHNGTFNNNTLVMRAGHAGLTQVYTSDVCIEFNAMGNALLERLSAAVKGTKMCFTGIGSLMSSHFTNDGVQTIERETAEDQDLKDLFFYEMLEQKFWVGPLLFVCSFLPGASQGAGRVRLMTGQHTQG